MTPHGLTQEPSDDGLPLTPLGVGALSAWLDRAPAATRAWVDSLGFEGAPGSTCLLPGDDGRLAGVLVGVADPRDPFALAALPRQLPRGRYRLECDWSDESRAAAALGWGLGSYAFDRYTTPAETPATLELPAAFDLDAVLAVLDAVCLTRDLINTPAADMMPADLAAAARQLAERHAATITVIEGDDLLAQGFPMVHAVGRASVHAPALVDLHWGDPSHPRLTLVGKGVCFDSGGLDLKSAAAMRLMKKDMGGAAHVLGLASALMARRVPVRLRVLVPTVENAVAGNAFRPGDILRARNGKTVEIDNTDAEGRLILADALVAAHEEAPDLIVDFATLTGAARVALGTELPALFCNDDALAGSLQSASERVRDPLWRMPLHRPYRGQLDSPFADLVNAPAKGTGGAITAALFLAEFVGDASWAHVDVMAYNTSSSPGRPEGGEAMGLRAFLAAIEARFG